MIILAEHWSSLSQTILTAFTASDGGSRVTPAEAELAFVVEDAYQGQGIGSKLVESTIERAHRAGFKRLVVDVVTSNYRVRHLAGDYGLDIADLREAAGLGRLKWSRSGAHSKSPPLAVRRHPGGTGPELRPRPRGRR